MCAMLAMIVPKELGVAEWRATIFLESYLGWSSFFVLTRSHSSTGLLARLQLHVPAANIRKHTGLEEIKSSALVRQQITDVEPIS